MLNLAGIVEDSIVDGPGFEQPYSVGDVHITARDVTILRPGVLRVELQWKKQRF